MPRLLVLIPSSPAAIDAFTTSPALVPLRPGGRLFSREPTNTKHGMPAAQLRDLFAAAGLSETLASEGKAPILGEHYRAVWTKPG